MIEYWWTFGCLYVVAMAYLTLHHHNGGGDDDTNIHNDASASSSSSSSWRSLVVLCALPSLVALVVGYLFVPESARWLCTEGRTDQALAILRSAATRNGLDATLVFPPHVQLQRQGREKHASIADLFQPAWMEITLRLWGTWGAFAFGYYGTILAINKVFAEPQSSSSQESSSYNFDYSAIFVSSAAELVGTTLVILVVDRIGRIPSQVVCYLGGGISVFLLCACAEAGANRLLLIALGFAARVFAMGATCVTWVVRVEKMIVMAAESACAVGDCPDWHLSPHLLT
jgi:MFS family permease